MNNESTKKVFVTRAIPQIGIDMLRAKGYEVDVNTKDRNLSPRELAKALKAKPYDAVLSIATELIEASAFDATPNAKIFANYGVGYNNIDLAEAKKRGIIVTNTPGVAGRSVAEHTVALILALTTRMVESDAYVRKNKRIPWAPLQFLGTDIDSKTVGLIGVGSIGMQAAKILKNGFGVNVIYYDVNPHTEVEALGAVRRNSIEEVLKEADFVSLHVPLLDSTRHLMNEARFNLMKPSAFLINTARGPVVDEAALVKALQNKKIAGAGLDVFEFEPKVSKGLLKLPNVILTPHIASAKESVRIEMAKIAAQNIIDVLETGVTKNRVN